MNGILAAALLGAMFVTGCTGGGVSIPEHGKFIDVVSQRPVTPSAPKPEAVMLRPLLVYGRGVLEENELASYVRGIVERLLSKWPGPHPAIAVYIVPSPDFTAEALRDGAIMLTTGTFETISRTPSLANEDALAFLVAHEVSHVLLGHPGERTRSSDMLHHVSGVVALGSTVVGHTKFVEAAKMGVNIAMGNELGMELADTGLFPSWSRAQEEQADTLGIDLMARAGYSVEAVPAILEALQATEAQPATRPDLIVAQQNGFRIQPGEVVKAALLRMSRTHPAAGERDRAARQYIEREYGDQLVALDDQRLKAAAASSAVQDLLTETHLVQETIRAQQLGQIRQAAATLSQVRRTAVQSSAVAIYEQAVLAGSSNLDAIARLDNAIQQPHATWPMFLYRAKIAERANQPEQALQIYRAAYERLEVDETYPARIQLLHRMNRGLEATALQVRCITLGDNTLRMACEAANK